MVTLLLIRPEAQSRQLQRSLAARGLRPPTVISPVMEIMRQDITLPAGADLVLTSQNAVAAVPAGRWRAWCVGDRTAAAASAAGLEAVSAGGDVEALLARLEEARPGALIHVRGAHATGDVVARLKAAGHVANEVVAYDQSSVPLTAEAAALLGGTGAVVLPLYSPRSARLVAEHNGPWRSKTHAVAISEAAAMSFTRPAHLTVADAPSGEAMEQAIAETLVTLERSRLVDRGGAS